MHVQQVFGRLHGADTRFRKAIVIQSIPLGVGLLPIKSGGPSRRGTVSGVQEIEWYEMISII